SSSFWRSNNFSSSFLYQLNARNGFPIIHYPKDCGSFPALQNFSSKFDPHVGNAQWCPTLPNAQIEIKKNTYIHTIENGHVVGKAGIKSLSFKLIETKNKLKPEYQSLDKSELKKIAIDKGAGFITNVEEKEVLGYSGDTPVEDLDRWKKTKILIHEATFLGGKEDQNIKTHGNAHSNLNDVLKMVSESETEKLILGHFSSRYSKDQIDHYIQQYCKEFNIGIPVYRLLPGRVAYDILSGKAVNL
ncbi:MAG: hypothetical protein MRY83_14125, partial [Flavobacteriales bacterium]|nr:hypothetical protein [Flavobacteriales bacterium]